MQGCVNEQKNNNNKRKGCAPKENGKFVKEIIGGEKFVGEVKWRMSQK